MEPIAKIPMLSYKWLVGWLVGYILKDFENASPRQNSLLDVSETNFIAY